MRTEKAWFLIGRCMGLRWPSSRGKACKLLVFRMIIPFGAGRTFICRIRGGFAAASATAVPIWMPKQTYHTASCLGRYIHASAEQNPSQHISICGPDATTIGVDLNLQMAALMNCSTGKVAVATPQVNEVPLISVWSYNLVV